MPASETPGRLIIVSGPVGAGKSTVAKELKSRLPGPTIYIEGDTFWSYIVRNHESDGFRKAFRAAMRAMVAAAAGFASSEYDVILDFSIPPWYLEGVKKIVGARDITVDYVVIRPSMEVCAHRAATREEGKFADYSGLKDLYDSFASVDKHIICDDSADASSLADQIHSDLSAQRFRLTV